VHLSDNVVKKTVFLFFLLFVGDMGFRCDGIMNFKGWHSWIDVSSIVTLAVIQSKMCGCLSSFVNTVKTAFTDAVLIWFTLMPLFFWNVAPHIIGWLCLPLRNRTIWYSKWTFQPLKMILYKVFIFPSNTSIITIKSIFKATCFSPLRPSSGLTIRTGFFTSSTFWDPKLFTKVVWCYDAVCYYLH